ncbi:MAG: flippase [Chloroflexaceae bacterium]|nr:flippase [Chloroflexaceae bacterium]
MLSRIAAINQRLSPGLRKIIGNIGWLTAERLLGFTVTLSVGIYVIRYLGAEDFGKLSYALSFVGLFSAIAKLGLDSIVVRNIVREESATQEVLGTAFGLKLISSSTATFLAILAAFNFRTQSEVPWIVLIISVGLIIDSLEVIDFWFQSQVQAGAMVLARSITLIVSSIAKLFLVAIGAPLIAFAWLILVDYGIKAIGRIIIYFANSLSILKWQFNWSIARELTKDSWPLVLAGMMVSIYMKIDQVMLGNMVGDQAVGNYAAAVRFSELWYFIPAAICASIFPSIVRVRQKNREQYYLRLQMLYDLMAWISFSIAVPLMFFSGNLLNLLLGQGYNEAGKILALHIWAAPFVFLGVARSQWLTAENYTGFSFGTTFMGAGLNLGLNYLLIPSLSGVGAAIATLVSYAFATHIACLLYPQMHNTGWMLTKSLFIPFRIRQNLLYFKSLKTKCL